MFLLIICRHFLYNIMKQISNDGCISETTLSVSWIQNTFWNSLKQSKTVYSFIIIIITIIPWFQLAKRGHAVTPIYVHEKEFGLQQRVSLSLSYITLYIAQLGSEFCWWKWPRSPSYDPVLSTRTHTRARIVVCESEIHLQLRSTIIRHFSTPFIVQISKFKILTKQTMYV